MTPSRPYLMRALNEWILENDCTPYVLVDAGLPAVVIEKMKAKNNDTITLTIDLIQGVCNSQFYSSDKNYLKVYSILNILLSVLENTISNSESVCNSIKGQMKGFEFGGKKEKKKVPFYFNVFEKNHLIQTIESNK